MASSTKVTAYRCQEVIPLGAKLKIPDSSRLDAPQSAFLAEIRRLTIRDVTLAIRRVEVGAPN